MTQTTLHELAAWLDDTLQTGRFRDYCPNGLQVEGRESVGHIIAGVTASQALIEAAIREKADAILVHHGWFWKNEDPRVRGPKRARLARMLEHGLSLLAYHLPLDAHPVLGNNAQLARVLGWEPALDAAGAARRCGPDDLVWLGRPRTVAPLAELARDVGHRLGREPLVIGEAERPIARVAWCTGAAQGMMDAAVDAGVDAYLTGEVSEQTVHLARETGVAFIGAGHHATERYGVQALGAAVAARFDIRCEFVDIDNPV
ncbi:Nif3-like dinuclear metal center hexameric protein [Castellaniella sp. GW247-6E4]|uniref:Nif3-like dinuclear metal center hexameric protein n=1 Tax=Castellaniella sp. GW247-6E4 TaxID=3140380 RepID=UPI0033157842